MNTRIHTSQALRGTMTVAADKSICQRAVLLAAFADGVTEIAPWPLSDDCQQALRLIRALGAEARLDHERLTVQGHGLAGLRAPAAPISCGESGTTFRLAAGLLAGCPWTTTLSGSPSLVKRPMRRIAEPLIAMGAGVRGASGAVAGELYPPITIEGKRPLKALRYTLPVASAQVKSAVLFAGLAATDPTTVIEPQPTRDHTERLLRAFGVQVAVDRDMVTVTPGALRSPGALTVPGDISSAAFLIVAALCVPGSRVELHGVSLNPRRSATLLAILHRMGGAVRVSHDDQAWEPSGTLQIEGRELCAVTVEPEEVPGVIDELPALMVAAACANGISRFRGVAELRVKETDRVRSMLDGLTRLGAKVRLTADDTVEIEGGPLVGTDVDGAGDHRTIMSLAIAGLRASGETVIRGAEAVGKSFPDFFDRLAALGAPVST